MDYYELNTADDGRMALSIDKHFSNGTPVNKWDYSRCRPVTTEKPVPLSIYAPGSSVDYCPTAFGAIVVSRKLALLIDGIAPSNIQRVPAVIEDADEKLEILNILSSVDCIDHKRSIIQYYPEDHKEYPREPRAVVKLIVDARRIPEDKHIFLPAGWKVTQVISGRLKRTFEENHVTGIEYVSVTE